MKPIQEHIKRKPWLGWVLFLLSMGIVFLLGLLASSIIERRAEAEYIMKPSADIQDWQPDNAVWGQHYPKEYERYLMTSDTGFRSLYNGNTMIDMLKEDPRLVILWAGYGFSKDYKQGRGHYYAIEDIWKTLRTGAPMSDMEGPMPNTCWTCKSTDVPRIMDEIGIDNFYQGKWASRGHQVINPIGCSDCHDPQTMNLRITRPALIEAYERMGKDIRKASHQEMRSLVCAQCHVEYYFKGDGKYLTFPWDNGTSVEDMEAYYDAYEFADWVHPLSKAPMIKAQHPGYEVFMTGIHYERGVSCADCHMPYISEGGQKFTDHWIQSPLNNISNSCQVCHRENEAALAENVYTHQRRVIQNRNKAEELLVRAHVEAKTAWDAGATEEEMTEVLQLIRHSQWRWDYAAASHGGSFHSPVETLRILGTSIEKSQQSRIILARILSKYGINKEIPYPNITTKQKAQDYIKLDVEKLQQEKQEFVEEVIPQWLERAEN